MTPVQLDIILDTECCGCFPHAAYYGSCELCMLVWGLLDECFYCGEFFLHGGSYDEARAVRTISQILAIYRREND